MMSILDEMGTANRQLIVMGYKITRQREATLRVLFENEAEHLSAEEIFMLVKKNNPDIGLATVYRTLDLLNELDIVEKINFGDGVARFDLRSKDHEHMHHHLLCSECGQVKEIKEDWLQEMEVRLEKEFGFKVSDHRLEFTGRYHKCANKSCKKVRKAV
ncbi:ferric iron uptake transcriptional regulator [Paenibacillus nasutitermitis]|uniref:Ferric uptake regulation protein n=1 Tax=Paenibacillus nasutitermitis TaxID=1652958 RepID=A0A916YNS6_9BACL|nr:transcriptional repressor [Paenibacillus nasutitermitis]GGD54263.1 ferric uptake regulation protein [Paenibacillus nasutitermitis]